MKKSGAELGQQAQATAAAAGARAGAAAARGALRGMRQSPRGRGARGGPGAPAGARGPALRLPHPARPAPCAALGPRRAPEESCRRFPGGDQACPRGTSSGWRGRRGEDAAAAAAAPGGADSAGEGGAAAAAGPQRVGALSPSRGASCSLMRGPPAPPPLAAAVHRASPHGLLAPTRRRQEAPVSSRRLLLRDSPRRSPEPPCPPSALSWLSGPAAAAWGSKCRTPGLRGQALGGLAPAGWLRLGQLSPARRAHQARRPAASACSAQGQGPPCAERASECARGSPPPARPPAPAPFLPLPTRPQRRRRHRLLPAPPPPLRASARLVPLRSGAPGSGLVTSASSAQLWNAFGRLMRCEGQQPGEKGGSWGLACLPQAGFLQGPEDLRRPPPASGRGEITL
ncbi:skin secretory protein xP2-like [Loxodonta africana]|uniref:skin secretory protein xP2-like n=1 Tax=Loxodonta africana TaxID=9785 RepID=UPI0030D2D10C